jgi:tetratricopeptide (TPR) repeat protein
MLDRLKSEGVGAHYKDNINPDKKDGSAFDYILRLFKTADLSPEQEQILLWMTMMPYTGMDIGLFHDICELESYDDLNVLAAHSWLNLDEDTDILSMHPIIADVVRDRLKPDVEKGKTYIAGLWREVGSLWFNSRQERAEMWPYYGYLISHFYDPIPELWTEFGYLETNAWICGHYDLSIETGHRFLDYTKKHFPDDHKKIGIAANWLGGCYHNSGDDLHAAPYYEEGLENQLKNIREDSDYAEWNELGSVYQKVGRCAYMAGDFKKSKACFDEARRIGSEKCDQKGYYCNALLETGCMYEAMGDYEQAVPYLQASRELYDKMSGSENPNSACSLTNIGKCCTRMGRYEEAEKALAEALRLNIKFNGTDNRQTFWAKEAIADLALTRGNKAEALEMYQELEVEMSQCFGERSTDLKAIREKIAGCETES